MRENLPFPCVNEGILLRVAIKCIYGHSHSPGSIFLRHALRIRPWNAQHHSRVPITFSTTFWNKPLCTLSTWGEEPPMGWFHIPEHLRFPPIQPPCDSWEMAASTVLQIPPPTCCLCSVCLGVASAWAAASFLVLTDAASLCTASARTSRQALFCSHKVSPKLDALTFPPLLCLISYCYFLCSVYIQLWDDN